MRFFTGILLFLLALPAAGAEAPPEQELLDPARAPGPVRRTLFRVQMMRARGEIESARRALRDHLAGKPDADHALLHFTLGQVLAQGDSLEAAAEAFAAAVALEPGLWPAWRSRAEAAYGLGRYCEAADAFGEAWTRDPARDPRLRHYQGVALLQAGRATEALDVLAELLAEPPPEADLEWFRALTAAAVEADRASAAAPAMEAATARWPDDPEAWILGYQLASAAGDYPRAVRNLTVAGFLRPLTRDEQRQLGDLSLAAGAPLRAVRAFEAVVDTLGSTDPADLDRLVSAHLAADRPGDALAVLDRRLTAAPTARFWRLKGELHYGRGEYVQAEASFAAAAGLAPNDREYDLLRGYCLVETGERDRAETFLRRAAADPGWASRAREALAYLEGLREQEEAARAAP